jgi:non-ribosomal peptide synthetase component F
LPKRKIIKIRKQNTHNTIQRTQQKGPPGRKEASLTMPPFATDSAAPNKDSDHSSSCRVASTGEHAPHFIKNEDTTVTAQEEHVSMIVSNAKVASSNAITTQKKLHHYFEASCQRTPQAIVLCCGGSKLSYSDLNTGANRLANHLRNDLNIVPEANVCILLPRSVHMYVSILAVLKCGAAYVPMDACFPSERLVFMVEDSNASLVITTSKLRLEVKIRINNT